GGGDGAADRLRWAPAVPAFRRPAAARRARPRPGQPAAGAAARRAARRARLEAARADADRAEGDSARGRYYVHVCHARPGRGPHPERPARGLQRRAHRAGRAGACRVCADRERVRGGIRRDVERPLRRLCAAGIPRGRHVRDPPGADHGFGGGAGTWPTSDRRRCARHRQRPRTRVRRRRDPGVRRTRHRRHSRGRPAQRGRGRPLRATARPAGLAFMEPAPGRLSGFVKSLGVSMIITRPAVAIAAALCLVAACSSSKSGGEKLPNIPVQKSVGAGEGALNIIAWAGYAEDGSDDKKVDWVHPFEQQTGCSVHVKIGNTSDEMVALMKTGQYDGVSASGDATLRLIYGGGVPPVDPSLGPNYPTVSDLLKNGAWNSVNGQMYGIPHGWGANLLMWDPKRVPANLDSWSAVFDQSSQYKGHVTAYDSPIYIADAALY